MNIGTTISWRNNLEDYNILMVPSTSIIKRREILSQPVNLSQVFHKLVRKQVVFRVHANGLQTPVGHFYIRFSPHFPHISQLSCKKLFGNCRFFRSLVSISTRFEISLSLHSLWMIAFEKDILNETNFDADSRERISDVRRRN